MLAHIRCIVSLKPCLKLCSLRSLNCILRRVRSQNNEFSFFLLTIDTLKMLIDLAFLIPTLSLFHSFMQYGKNVLLKDVTLVVIKTDEDLSK